MEQNSVTNSSNAGASLRKEDIHQMIDGRNMNEDVRKHFDFLFSKGGNTQLSAFLASKQLLLARPPSTAVKNDIMQYSSFDLKSNYMPSQILSVMPNIKEIIDCILYIIIFMRPNVFKADFIAYQEGGWTEELSLQASDITQSPTRELYLYDNHRATIVKEIAHIHFTALTSLNLSGNWIESVEGLARVQMAHIQILCLQNNNITSVEVIRKTTWPNLQQLYMVSNYFGDANSLVHGCFPHMAALSVYVREGDVKNGFREHCFPAKMQAASLKYLCIRENKFCFDRCLKRVLQERWPDIQIE